MEGRDLQIGDFVVNIFIAIGIQINWFVLSIEIDEISGNLIDPCLCILNPVPKL